MSKIIRNLFYSGSEPFLGLSITDIETTRSSETSLHGILCVMEKYLHHNNCIKTSHLSVQDILECCHKMMSLMASVSVKDGICDLPEHLKMCCTCV